MIIKFKLNKIHLTIAINFISSKDSDEARTTHIESDNIEIMVGSETDEIMEEILETLLQRYKKKLEESMKGSESIFDSVDVLHYNLNKISLNHGRLYIDFPKWLKTKKTTINPKNNDDKCFQYALISALKCQNIRNNLERLTKIKPFIGQYNWEETEFPSHKKRLE